MSPRVPHSPNFAASLVVASALLAAAAVAVQCSGGGGTVRPNVILVTLDTTRPDYLSCYGGSNPTPNLDDLARGGVRFELTLSASAVTPVSHASILTGLFPYQHGLRVLSAGSGFRLPEGQRTVASVMQAAGYTTGAVHSAFPVSGYFGFERDYDHFDSLDGALTVRQGDTKSSWDSRTLQRRSDETTDRCLEFLRDAQQKDRPFFLWVHYWDPHDPTLKPPREFISHIQIPASGMAASSGLYEEFYAAEVRYLDQQFGRLLAGLRDLGLDDDTLVAVTADHGEGLADGFQRHGWGKHRMTYQEQLHVPLILNGPGIPAGGVVRDMVRTVDIVPTLLDYVGLLGTGMVMAGMDGTGPVGALESRAGRSLRPLIEGGSLPVAVAYADQINGYDANASMVGARPDAAFLYTVCDGEWKLTYRPHMPERSELFHLSSDPREEHNVHSEEPEVVLRLMADLASRDPWVLAPFADDGSLDPKVSSALGALGYAQSGSNAESTWWWTCPAHPDYRRETRESDAGSRRHDLDGCQQPVVVRTEWL